MICSAWCRLTVNLFLFQGLWLIIQASRTERSVDRCPPQWDEFGNKCYRMFGSEGFGRETWNGADSRCGEIGSTLVSIHSKAEQDYLESYLRSVDSDIWIGLHLLKSEDIFHWADHTTLDYTNWEQGEPNFFNGEEECVHLNFMGRPLGTWNDHRCARLFPYICQIPKGACGGDFVSEQGVISSPNFPNNYGSNARCIWTITVPEGYQVYLTFNEFTVEEDDQCDFDYVMIFDGPDQNSTVLGKVCGFSVPDAIISSGNQMSIEFKSDPSYQFKGFTAEFRKDTASGIEVESLLRELPKVIAGKKIEKLKKKQKESSRKKSKLLRALEERYRKL